MWTRYPKYHNKKTFAFGIQFDSKKEAERYQELKLLEAAGEVQNVKTQVKFPLLPVQRDESGKCIERAVSYVADFTYFTKDGQFVVEDTKGVKTPEYILKRKLLYYFHKIKIQEI